MLLVPRLSKILFKNLFSLPSRARLRATVKSLSTWSSKFIRSTIVITHLSCRAWYQADRRTYMNYIPNHRLKQGSKHAAQACWIRAKLVPKSPAQALGSPFVLFAFVRETSAFGRQGCLLLARIRITLYDA